MKTTVTADAEEIVNWASQLSAEIGGAPLSDCAVQSHITGALIDRLPSLAEELRHAGRMLEERGHAVVAGFPLAELSIRERDVLTVAGSGVIARPTPIAENSDLVAWDVRPSQRAEDVNVSVTFGPAEMHTDSAFQVVPERYFGLWCVRAATDGGASTIGHASRAVEDLQGSARGRDALDRLTNAAPFWRGEDDVLWAPVLDSGELRIRLRPQVLRLGANSLPPSDRSELVAATNALLCALDASANVVPLASGEALFVNNHTHAHGRTAFLDENRYLIRVRMTGRPLC